MFTPDIDTERLCLRPIRLEDTTAVFNGWAKDDRATQYLNWPTHRSIVDTNEYIGEVAEDNNPDARLWVITHDEQVIGSVRLGLSGHKADIGYVLSPQHWGRGYMGEAVKAVIAYAFETLSVHRVWAVCDVDNGASAGVLKKVGMHKEGVLRGWLVHPQISSTPRDCSSYSILRSDCS